MSKTEHVDLEKFMEGVEKRNPGQTEFVQAVRDVSQDVPGFIEGKEDYHEAQILRRMAEPDRVVSFRVTYGERDDGSVDYVKGFSYGLIAQGS